MWQAINWTNGGLIYWRIHASHGLDELKHSHRLLTFCANEKWNNVYLHAFVLEWGFSTNFFRSDMLPVSFWI